MNLGIIGDFKPDYPLHLATNEAILHHAPSASIEWLDTDKDHDLSRFHGLWCSPGSPYRSCDGALRMITWARTKGIPFLGTCAGFQHAALEFARSVMGLHDAQHSEYDESAPVQFLHRLSCSLAGKTLAIEMQPESLAASIYGRTHTEEGYYCNFGLNPEYRQALDAAGMKISGWENQGEARIIELPGHPFFLGTLFVPQARKDHPIVRAFLNRVEAQVSDPLARHATRE